MNVEIEDEAARKLLILVVFYVQVFSVYRAVRNDRRILTGTDVFESNSLSLATPPSHSLPDFSAGLRHNLAPVPCSRQ
jgi:hypothetical protein